MKDTNDYRLCGQRVSFQDLKKAEVAIVRYTQSQFFPKEIEMLETKTPEVKKESALYRLHPVLRDGMMRVGGQLSRLIMGEDRKFPVILPKNYHVSTVILQHIHKTTGHR